MTSRFIKLSALAIALSLSLGACMPSGPNSQYQAQYFNDLRPCPPGFHSQSSPFGMGYSCVQ